MPVATMGVGAWRTKRNLGNALSCEIWSNPLGSTSIKFVRLTPRQSETAKSGAKETSTAKRQKNMLWRFGAMPKRRAGCETNKARQGEP
jgi:hypothetical protein